MARNVKRSVDRAGKGSEGWRLRSRIRRDKQGGSLAGQKARGFRICKRMSVASRGVLTALNSSVRTPFTADFSLPRERKRHQHIVIIVVPNLERPALEPVGLEAGGTVEPMGGGV
jgi:hypothetical protein